MKTFQDLLPLAGEGKDERKLMDFILSAIADHKSSPEYELASVAKLYATGKNATIMAYQKLLYTLSGEAIPDNYSANHKCASGFFKRFVTQEVAYLLGNGVTFEKEGNKAKLGKDIDTALYRGAKKALVQGVSFGFYNNDHVDFFGLDEFIPLWDEENGSLSAGIRFWQLASDKPLRATLYEKDGYTDFIRRKDKDMEVLRKKQTYVKRIVSTPLEGDIAINGENYPGFPIVPLWANPEHQSELVGHREQIDCYDLIKSGFANDLDEASMFYWTINGAGGMEEIDLVKFKQQMKTLKAALLDGDGKARAESHTIDMPYQARESYLSRLEKDLYKDFMALDVEQIAAGQVTATQIEAAYEPLNEKADEFEMCLHDFFDGIFAVAGIEDEPSFKRSQIVNKQEETDMVLSASQYLDDETILNKLPFILPDEVANIMVRKEDESAAKIIPEEPTEPEPVQFIEQE